jgi:hypothetical protein
MSSTEECEENGGETEGRISTEGSGLIEGPGNHSKDLILSTCGLHFS